MEDAATIHGLGTVSSDELVVVQLLEEIRRLALLPGGADTPGAINPRRMAAAKLYLDTRDAFEVVERQVEEHVHEKPKLLRKLSKRSSMNSVTSGADGQGASAGESPRLGPSSPTASPRLNERVIDCIQDMFRELGELLGTAILRELQQRRLTLQSILHYVRFLPAELQWTAYSDARREEVAAAYRSPTQPQQAGTLHGAPAAAAASPEPSLAVDPDDGTSVSVLKRHAEFVKHEIRRDVDTVCLFSADGTLSTIFGDDVASIQENVAGKFESLLTDVYSQYLVPPLEAQMDSLLEYSNQWSREMAEAAVATTAAVTAAADAGGSSGNGALASTDPLQPYATYYARPRRYRSKLNIFSDHLGGIDDRFGTALLPPMPPGQHVKLLVADGAAVGVWWQKSVFSASERDVTTLHDDAQRKVSSRVESLDGHIYAVLLANADLAAQFDLSARRLGKHAWVSRWVGQRVLVNTGRDSLWLEVRITDVDERKCKLRLKPSLEGCALLDGSSLAQLLQLDEWLNARDLRFVGVPVCPDFRTFMGLRFRETLELMQSVVVEVSSIFPNGELGQKVRSALWALVEPSVGKGEHIFSRYFRSTLQLDVFSTATERSQMYASLVFMRSRGLSLGRAATLKAITALAEAGAASSSANYSSNAHGSRNSSMTSHSAATTSSAGLLDRDGEPGPSASAKPALKPSFSAAPGAFSASGRYEVGSSDASFSLTGSSYRPGLFGNCLSPFDKLAHHLLEETEVVGACMQAHSVALSRALVQVLAEKVSKVRRRSSDRLRQCGGGGGSAELTLELVLAEYASAVRLLHVWRICRHELDTVPRQRRPRLPSASNSAIHFTWVDRAFERMERELLETIDTLAHFAHRAFFHESVAYVLPGVFEQAWTASKPWFGNTRCTYAVQAWVFRLQLLLERVRGAVLCKHERSLGVHEKLHKLLATMLLDVFASLTEAYASLLVSRARLAQWKMDVLYLVCGVHKLLRLLDHMVTARMPQLKKSTAPLNRVRVLCLRLLEHVAVRCGPGAVVLQAAGEKIALAATCASAESSSENPRGAEGDVSMELESHIAAIYTALDATSLLSTSVLAESATDVLWQAHSVFQDTELRKLADVQLDWAALVAQSRFSSERLVLVLQQRHEVGEWAFPPLTDTQLQFRDQLQQFLDRHDEHEQREEAVDTSVSDPSAETSTDTIEEPPHDSEASSLATSAAAPSESSPSALGRSKDGPTSAMLRGIQQSDPQSRGRGLQAELASPEPCQGEQEAPHESEGTREEGLAPLEPVEAPRQRQDGGGELGDIDEERRRAPLEAS